MYENPPLLCESCSTEQLDELVQGIDVLHSFLFFTGFLFTWFLTNINRNQTRLNDTTGKKLILVLIRQYVFFSLKQTNKIITLVLHLE